MAALFLSLCVFSVFTVVTYGKTREYYIAAVEIDWNYAPEGNLMSALQSDYDAYLKPSIEPPRIGNVYRKALLREFTDKTFTTMKDRPSWMGILGPIIRAEVNDVVIVHFFNNASGNNFTLHPHGIRYDKNSEGALYIDGTNGTDKADDAVPPGGHHTYYWHVDPRYGPTEGDPLCLTWAYHSHRYAERDINTGLVGAMIICQPGILSDVKGGRKDVDQEYVLFYHMMDENKSWYIEQNLAKLGISANQDEILEDEDFAKSNLMGSINGYVYGNLHGIDACVGDTISWHLLSLGNEVDVHVVRFQGQSMIKRDRRTNFASLFPAKFVTLRSKAQFSGNWSINCEVYDHLKAGMQAYFNVENCGKSDDFGFLVKDRTIRKYNIAAEEVIWDYAPSGLNKVTGEPLETDQLASQQFSKEGGRIGGQYIKAVYRQYEDDNFTIPSSHESYFGILGPVISGEVGDILKIMFFNNASRPYSLLLSGPTIQVNGTGLKILGLEANSSDQNGAIVQPGETFTYFWLITTEASLTSLDEDCISSYYSSYVDVSDNYAGLLGMVLICRKGLLKPNGEQNNVDKQLFLVLTNFNENESPYLDENIQRFSNNATAIDKSDPDFQQSNIMYSINGLMYDNLEGLNVCLGDRVIWHVFTVGAESDVHVLNVEDLALTYENSHRDMIDLFPGVSRTFTMTVDSPGVKDVTCQTNTHYAGGMRVKLHVENCPLKSANTNFHTRQTSGKVRTYYIAAVEEEWDYAPNETHPIFAKNLLDVEQSRIFIQRDATHIGKKYKKALFREFTDGTFTTKRRRSEDYLGILGPVIKGEVGDTIKIKFKNLATRNYNIKAHGVLQTTNVTDVPPNTSADYEWKILERSGPGKDDLNCIAWAYSSAVDPTKDVNTGLVGPLITCRPGTLDSDGKRKDVKKEFALLFAVSDENKSWYLDENIQTYCSKPNEVNTDDDDFQESNKMHGINGYVYGNLKGLSIKENEPAAIYLIGFGDEVDIHTVHFHGETFVSKHGQKRRGDVKEVFPGTFETIQLQPGNSGSWLLHCHINDHMEAGMMTTFTVLPAKHDTGSSGFVVQSHSSLWPLSMNLALSSFIHGR